MAGPVAGFGDEAGERLVGFCGSTGTAGCSWGIDEGGEGVPVAQWRASEREPVPEEHCGVGEVEADGMGGQGFGGDGDASEEEPGVEDGEGCDDQHPEQRQADDDTGGALVGICSSAVGEEAKERPEEDNDGPGAEAMSELEVVVQFEADAWVGGDNDCQEEELDHPC